MPSGCASPESRQAMTEAACCALTEFDLDSAPTRQQHLRGPCPGTPITDREGPPQLPMYLIIGSMKAGTGEFVLGINQHPQVVTRRTPVGLSTLRARTQAGLEIEAHYFDLPPQNGCGWAQYSKFFLAYAPAADVALAQVEEAAQGNELPVDRWNRSEPANAITGDKSPEYMTHPAAPQRAACTVPHAKVIAMVRNPVDRASSHYYFVTGHRRHTVFRTAFADPHNIPSIEEMFGTELAVMDECRLAETLLNETDPFVPRSLRVYEECVFPQVFQAVREAIMPPHWLHAPHLLHMPITRGLYVFELLQWLRYYPLEQVMVRSAESFFTNQDQAVREAWDWLGLDAFDKTSLRRRQHRLRHRMLLEVHDRSETSGSTSSETTDAHATHFANASGKKPLSHEMRKQLEDFYEPFNQKVLAQRGLSFPLFTPFTELHVSFLFLSLAACSSP